MWLLKINPKLLDQIKTVSIHLAKTEQGPLKSGPLHTTVTSSFLSFDVFYLPHQHAQWLLLYLFLLILHAPVIFHHSPPYALYGHSGDVERLHHDALPRLRDVCAFVLP